MPLPERSHMGWYIGLLLPFFAAVTYFRLSHYYSLTGVEASTYLLIVKSVMVWTIPLLFIRPLERLGLAFSLESRGKWRMVPLHVLFSLLFLMLNMILLHISSMLLVDGMINRDYFGWANLRSSLLNEYGTTGFMTYSLYWFIVLRGYYLQQLEERERIARRNNQLAEEHSRIELKYLESRLSPHFIFNTFSMLSRLIDKDVQKARRVLKQISKLFRQSFSFDNRSENFADDQLIPLSSEMEMNMEYLEIEQERYSDRLSIRMEVDPEAENVPIPRLLIHPLIENAVKHGISGSMGNGIIQIHAGMKNGQLTISVEDNGPGMSTRTRGKTPHTGIGLQSVRKRLELIYGESGSLELSDSNLGGLKATIRLDQN